MLKLLNLRVRIAVFYYNRRNGGIYCNTKYGVMDMLVWISSCIIYLS